MDRQVAITLQVGDVSSIPCDTKQDVLVALVDRNDTRAKEGVVKGRDEEVRLFYEVQFVSDVACPHVMLYTRIACLKGGNLSYLVASVQFSISL